MKQSIKYIGLLAILPLAMVALSPDIIADAHGLVAEGSPGKVPPKSYGAATKNIVCGDKLCKNVESKSRP